jgi:hypothetical protein
MFLVAYNTARHNKPFPGSESMKQSMVDVGEALEKISLSRK